MKFAKQIILTTAALSVAGMIGFANSQTSTDTTQPPTTSGQGTDARTPDTTPPANQGTTPTNPAATTQPSTPETSGSTMDSGSTAASSGSTATTPPNNNNNATMGSEQVARADRN